MEYELSDEARSIDDDFVTLSSVWSTYYWMNSNSSGYGEILRGAERIRNGLERFRPCSGFERLWMENTMQQSEVQETLARYLRGEQPIPVPELIDFACGPGSYHVVEDSIRRFDRPGAWELARKGNEIRKMNAMANTEAGKRLIDDYVPVIEREMTRAGAEGGYTPEGFEVKIDLSLPGTYGRPHWSTTLKRFHIGFDCFRCFESSGTMRLDPTLAYQIAFHEIIGHASQQLNSENMPASLRLADNNGFNIPGRVSYEGLAKIREKLAFDWLRKNKERLNKEGLNITDEEIDLRQQSFEDSSLLADAGTVSGILKEMELFAGIDAMKYAQTLTSSRRIAALVSGRYDSVCTIEQAIYDLCYPVGYKAVGALSERFAGSDSKKLNAAMSTGQWSWKVYPKAVEYFLKGEQK